MRTHATHLEAAKPRVLARLIRRIGLLISGCLLIAAPAMAQDYNERLLYDERGNLLQRSLQGRVIGYRYDGLDRLQEETAPGNQRLLLDADGNRLADGRSTYSVAQGGQRLAMRDGVALVHGPAGHLLADRTWRGGRWVQRQFDWTLDGQIKTVRLDGKTVATYHYNEARQRTRKTLATPPVGVPAITLYRYDPAGLLTLEVAGAAVQAPGVSVMPGQVLVRYLWQDAVPVAVVWPPMTPGNPNASTERIVYLHTDHLNTPRRASDARGVLVWQWISDAYGSSAPEEDPDQDGRPTTIHLRFPGQYFDVESGLHYNWNRYYDPQVGRYTQPDPIGLAGGINTYAYVDGNPISLADPDGLKTASAGWGGQGRQRPLPPMRPDGQPWGAGCGDSRSDHYVPDFFPKACAAHDQCYAQQCGKGNCDANFLRDMYNERPQMPAIPWLYFRAVDVFGGEAYRGATSSGKP
jgi:RHS repeat-associated protein